MNGLNTAYPHPSSFAKAIYDAVYKDDPNSIDGYDVNHESFIDMIGTSYMPESELVDQLPFSMQLVHSVGGGEGEGESVIRVFEIKSKDTNKVHCYVQINGYYDSWHGIDFEEDSWKFVQPKEKITVEYISCTSPQASTIKLKESHEQS